MQTAEHKPSSYRAIGRGSSGTLFAASNIAEAAKILASYGFPAYETADGLLTMASDVSLYSLSHPAAIADDDRYYEAMHIFPIVAGQVDMEAIAAFIGH